MARLPLAPAAAQQQAGAPAAPPPPPPELAAALRQVMRQHWGHADFRPLQAEAVAATLAGQDTLIILPTGGVLGDGCWQLVVPVRERTAACSPQLAPQAVCLLPCPPARRRQEPDLPAGAALPQPNHRRHHPAAGPGKRPGGCCAPLVACRMGAAAPMPAWQMGAAPCLPPRWVLRTACPADGCCAPRMAAPRLPDGLTT